MILGRGWSDEESGMRCDVIFPTGEERVRREEISMSFATETATATAAKEQPTMAGDHKCSVCQATFTRPQHVSRHMRSRKLLRLSSSQAPLNPPHRYRRSPIQVPALWRPVRQKVCPPSIFHLFLPHSSPFRPFRPSVLLRKRSPLEARQQMPPQRETSSFFYSFSSQGHLFYQQGHHLEASL